MSRDCRKRRRGRESRWRTCEEQGAVFGGSRWSGQSERFIEVLEASQTEGPQIVVRRGVEATVWVPADKWRLTDQQFDPRPHGAGVAWFKGRRVLRNSLRSHAASRGDPPVGASHLASLFLS